MRPLENSSTFLVTFFQVFVLLACVPTLGNGKDDNCDGEAYCAVFSTTIGIEFAQVDQNGTLLGCLYGHTGLAFLPTYYCERPCHGISNVSLRKQ